MGYENTTRNDFQVWPFKGQYSFVSSSHSCELNSEIWSYHLLGFLCVPCIGDNLGLKCFRRTSEPKVLLIWLWSSLLLSPPWTEMTMGFVNLRQDSIGAGMWPCTVMSQVRASAFSLYPELTSGYHLSSTRYTVVVLLSLKKKSFSRLQYYLIGKTKFKTKIISIIFLPRDTTVNVSVHFFSYFLYAITFYIQFCNLSDPQYLGWWYHVKMIRKGLRGVSQTEGDTHGTKEYDVITAPLAGDVSRLLIHHL